MANKQKVIRIMLDDGSLSGIMTINDSAWANGDMYSAPRESINDLISSADCKKYGVYLLLSDQQVYVGQASDLERRTKQHMIDKDWWTRVILMTTKNDSFNASDIDYLESRLIDIAEHAGKLDSDNKKRGNPQKVDKFRQVELEQYLDESLFLLELIGVRVFKKETQKTRSRVHRTIPEKTVYTNEDILSIAVTTFEGKPPLPSDALGPCEYAKTALKNLLAAGYVFSDEQIRIYSSVDGSRSITKRNLPLFWLLNDGETRATCEKSVRDRYWKDEFVSGKYRFLMYSQWYDTRGATKDDLKRWYNEL